MLSVDLAVMVIVIMLSVVPPLMQPLQQKDTSLLLVSVNKKCFITLEPGLAFFKYYDQCLSPFLDLNKH
jgi:hypothetical protein